jgi:stress response protein YsnF
VHHERARIEREPITDQNRAAASGQGIGEAEQQVTLRGERPVVEKEAVPVERVRLSKESVAGEEAVRGEVRKEQIETDIPEKGR